MTESPQDPFDVEISKELADALDGDRDAALAMWQCVERYPHGIESRMWAQEVARRILEAQNVTPKRRPDAIQKAVGLSGRGDKHRRLRDFVGIMRVFKDLGRTEPLKPGEESQRLFDAIRSQAKRDLTEQDPEQRYFDYDDSYLEKLAYELANHELRKQVDGL